MKIIEKVRAPETVGKTIKKFLAREGIDVTNDAGGHRLPRDFDTTSIFVRSVAVDVAEMLDVAGISLSDEQTDKLCRWLDGYRYDILGIYIREYKDMKRKKKRILDFLESDTDVYDSEAFIRWKMNKRFNYHDDNEDLYGFRWYSEKMEENGYMVRARLGKDQMSSKLQKLLTKE